MKDLVVKYLKDRYFEESEGESNMDNKTRVNIEGKGKHPKNIEDNINLLKRVVDRQTEQLAELNEKIDSMIK